MALQLQAQEVIESQRRFEVLQRSYQVGLHGRVVVVVCGMCAEVGGWSMGG